MPDPDHPCEANDYRRDLADPILASYLNRRGRPLLGGDGEFGGLPAKALFEAPFAVLAHGVEADPLLFYGNLTGLSLWESTWSSFTSMPSRLTAAPGQRTDRAASLRQALSSGVIAGYSGIRVSTKGRRFQIDDAVIWTVSDGEGCIRGQAAMIATWRFL